MEEFIDETINNKFLKYKLFGIINRHGTIDEGHYISLIKIGDFQYEFNDSIMNKIYNVNLKNDSVCIFFYKRISNDE